MSDEQRKPDWADAVLAEYDAHRAEVVSEAEAQQQTLAWGATAVGLVVAGAFNVWSNKLLASVAFLGVVPLLCLFVLVQWVGRAAGLMRVGVYLEKLENALRTAYQSAPPEVFSWEKGLTRNNPQRSWWGPGFWKPKYEWHDYGAIAIFALLAYGSIALGAYRAYARHQTTVIVLVAVEVLALSGFAIRLLREVATARDEARQGLKSTTPAG